VTAQSIVKLFIVVTSFVFLGPRVTSATRTAHPIDDCTLSCTAQPNVYVVDTNWFADFSDVTSGTGRVGDCATCTGCEALLTYGYVGVKTWPLYTSGGIQTGTGSTAGALLVTSTCDDETPGGIIATTGQAGNFAISAQLFCPCH
jgi:hypothetical protein